MRIIIICVNYNSYSELTSYIASISAAAKRVNNAADVMVAIGDNTPRELRQHFACDYPHITVQLYRLDQNYGYLGSAERVMKELRRESVLDGADLCIISNVDLILSDSFFAEVLSTPLPPDIGWIAPDVHTMASGIHENPFMHSAPSPYNFTLWRTLYRFPPLFYIYSKSAKIYAPIRASTDVRTEIYAGHGSIMIFTRNFMRGYLTDRFPSFMYCEEIYFAELIKRAKLKTIYCPNIIVYNIGGVSTNKLGLYRKAKMSYQSLTALQKIFFKN